jgi:hypothetical protein
MYADFKFISLFNELVNISNEILPYYDIDKVKWYSVYIWTKGNEIDPHDYGENVFDIEADKIVKFVKDHEIIEEAKPIIEKIQRKLKELSVYDNNVNTKDV